MILFAVDTLIENTKMKKTYYNSEWSKECMFMSE